MLTLSPTNHGEHFLPPLGREDSQGLFCVSQMPTQDLPKRYLRYSRVLPGKGVRYISSAIYHLLQAEMVRSSYVSWAKHCSLKAILLLHVQCFRLPVMLCVKQVRKQQLIFLSQQHLMPCSISHFLLSTGGVYVLTTFKKEQTGNLRGAIAQYSHFLPVAVFYACLEQSC